MNSNVYRIAQMFASLGFEGVSKSTVMTRLNRISPYGETALRDSIRQGVGLILKLNTFLDEIGSSGAFNFVHIVITDGVDTVSNTSLNDLAVLFALINRGIPTERCMTVFIGIDLSSQALAQLAVLSALGGDNCQMYNVNNVNLGEIFQRITATLGVQRQVSMGVASMGGMTAMRIQTTNRPVLNIVRRNFAVMLNLDLSSSMQGNRYNSLKNSVGNFMRNLDPNDLVSCLVFSDKVQLLNQIPLNQPSYDDDEDGGMQAVRCANQ